jgi:lycopene beta-cyclase
MTHDVVLVGGGLASGLTVLALRRRWPRLRLALVEAGPALGGNHTWSFHGTDLDDDGAALVEPLVERRWPAVAVAFADHQRRLPTPYLSFGSAALDRTVRAALAGPGSTLMLGARALRINAEEVELADGTILRAPLVLDGRGPLAPVPHAEGTAHQKFCGLEVDVDGDGWPDDVPLVMDARVPQDAGFRFVYVLPYTRHRLLVEDTYYSEDPSVEEALLRARIAAYLRQRGLGIVRVHRQESGCLPLPLEVPATPPLGSPLRLGYRGGWLHPTTGYSLPVAAAVATALAGQGWTAAVPALSALHRRLARQIRFCVRLNRLLFRAVEPPHRASVLARFYRLPRSTIQRFYALETTPTDRLRILWGRPPRGTSVRAALAAVEVR